MNNNKFYISKDNYIEVNGTMEMLDNSEEKTNLINSYQENIIINNANTKLTDLNVNMNKENSTAIFVINNNTIDIVSGNYKNLKLLFNQSSSSNISELTGENLLIENYGIFNADTIIEQIYISNFNEANIYNSKIESINSSNNLTLDDTYVITLSINDGYAKLTNAELYSVKVLNGAVLDLHNSIDQYGEINNRGTINIYGGELNNIKNYGLYTDTNNNYIRAYINIYSGTIAYLNDYLGIIKMYDGILEKIYDNGYGNDVYIYGGTVNNIESYNVTLGTKDGNVSTTNPIIGGGEYGIIVDGKFKFYDGIISGTTAAINGTVNDVESGYKVNLSTVDGIQSATLTLIGDNERVAVMNGINFADLQSAINSASDTDVSEITLYANITLNSDITIPESKKIRLYLNGFNITYGDYSFIENGTLEIINPEATSIMASIISTFKDTLGIDTLSKNIIVYEMDDGSNLSSERTYKLFKEDNNNYYAMNLKKEEEIGRYTIGNNITDMRTVRGRIYINNLSSGNYKIIDDLKNEILFTITEDGKLVGNIMENQNNESNKVVATAIAELIITIQTGILRPRYIILTILISILIMLLYIAKKQRESFE